MNSDLLLYEDDRLRDLYHNLKTVKINANWTPLLTTTDTACPSTTTCPTEGICEDINAN